MNAAAGTSERGEIHGGEFSKRCWFRVDTRGDKRKDCIGGQSGGRWRSINSRRHRLEGVLPKRVELRAPLRLLHAELVYLGQPIFFVSYLGECCRWMALAQWAEAWPSLVELRSLLCSLLAVLVF